MSDSISVQITVRIGEQVMKVSDSRPLFLSGDRRRWRSQIAAHIAEQTDVIGRRFDAPAPVSPAKPVKKVSA